MDAGTVGKAGCMGGIDQAGFQVDTQWCGWAFGCAFGCLRPSHRRRVRWFAICREILDSLDLLVRENPEHKSHQSTRENALLMSMN